MRLLTATLLLIVLTTASSGDEVASKAEAVRPILIGSNLPDTKVRNGQGKEIALRDLATGKPSVLVYYRGGWCPYCNLHLAALGKRVADLKRLGFELIAISADKPELVAQYSKQKSLGYKLYSDSKMAGAKSLGIAFRVGDETVKMYKNRYRIDLEANSGETHHILPVPSVFIVDKSGKVHFTYINPNYRVRLDDEVLMAAARAVLK